MAEPSDRPRWYQIAFHGAVYLGAGVLAFGAFLDALGNAIGLVSPLTTYVGTVLLLLAWGSAEVLLRRYHPAWVQPGRAEPLQSLGFKRRFGLLGMLILLWVPRFIGQGTPASLSAPAHAPSPSATAEPRPIFFPATFPPGTATIFPMRGVDIEIQLLELSQERSNYSTYKTTLLVSACNAGRTPVWLGQLFFFNTSNYPDWALTTVLKERIQPGEKWHAAAGSVAPGRCLRISAESEPYDRSLESILGGDVKICSPQPDTRKDADAVETRSGPVFCIASVSLSGALSAGRVRSAIPSGALPTATSSGSP